MPEIEGVQFDQVLNGSEDIGLDNTGTEDVTPGLRDALSQGNTLIELEPGKYKLGGNIRTSTAETGDASGIVGLGGRRDVVFVNPDKGTDKTLLSYRQNKPPSGVVVKNITFDLGGGFDRLLSLRAGVTGRGVVKNVEWTGASPNENNIDTAPAYHFNPLPHSTDSVYLAEDIYLTGPTDFTTYPDNAGFAYSSGPGHKGKLICRNWNIQESGASGLYAGRDKGSTVVEDSLFLNCHHTGLRVHGEDDRVRRTSFILDMNSLHGDTIIGSQSAKNQFNRLLWLFPGKGRPGGTVIEDCDFTITQSVPAPKGLAVLPTEAGSAEFRNCRFHNDSSGKAIFARGPGQEAIAPYDVLIEDCSFTGIGNGIDIRDREGSVVRDTCFDMPNGNIQGATEEGVSSNGCDMPDEVKGNFPGGGNGSGTGDNQVVPIAIASAIGLAVYGINKAKDQ